MTALGLVGLIGCSDPVPPAAQGAVSLHLATSQSDLKNICTPGPHWANAPDNPQGDPKTNGYAAGTRAVDGDQGMSVSCTVKQDGDAYNVKGNISTPATDVTGKKLDPTTMNFEFKIKPDQNDAPGTVLLFDDKTQAVYRSSKCTFSVKPVDDKPQLSVHPGRVWASVVCQSLTDPSNASTPSCDVDRAILVFENCEQ